MILRALFFLAAIGVSLLATMLPGRADAAPTLSTVRFTGTSAGGYFEGEIPTDAPAIGGLFAEVNVFASEANVTAAEGEMTFTSVFVDAFLYDAETHEPRLNCFGAVDVAAEDFSVDDRLRSASLETEVGVECTPAEGGDTILATVGIDLDWGATGGTFTTRGRSRDEHSTSTFTSRGVTAIATGEFVVNGTTVPAESLFADIHEDRGTTRCFTEECGFFP